MTQKIEFLQLDANDNQDSTLTGFDKPYILFVDDEKQILEIVKTQLRSHPMSELYEIEVAESGDEALETCQQLYEEGNAVAVIVSDQIMPGMKGDELLVQAHRLFPDTKKILLTGQAGLEAVTRTLNLASLYRYIAKPWEKMDLIMTVEEAGKSFLRHRYIQRQALMLDALYKASNILAVELKADEIIARLMRIVLKYAKASRGAVILYGSSFLVKINSYLYTEANEHIAKDLFCHDDKLDSLQNAVPMSIIEQVVAHNAVLYLPNVNASTFIKQDPYLQNRKPKSIFCQPLVHNGILEGIIYLESNDRYHAFNKEVSQFMELLAVNAAIALEKAKVYEQLDQKVELRTKEVIEQKRIIEEINTELTDSIRYASRIQSAIMPSIKVFRACFADCFVLYRPKKIISGDFYWFATKDEYIYFAAVDCTGHGVPGAMLSVLGSNLLNQIVMTNQPLTPVEILYQLDEQICGTLQQDAHEHHALDGMDVALCRFDINNLTLDFTGAMRSAILIQNHFLNEIKGDRISIGGRSLGTPKAFTNQTFNLKKGDTLFIYTDGITDQFSDTVPARKFSTKKLQAALERTIGLPMPLISNILSTEIDEWRGTAEQTDDILVLGIRI